MEVKVVAPFGFCLGVTKAIQIAKQAKEEHPNESVYVIGDLVHNERIIESLRQKGLTVLEGDSASLEKQLLALPEHTIIVFTAHGHAPKWDRIAKQKEMIVYDATCVFVEDNEALIRKEIERGGEVFYIGVKHHAEADAAVAIAPNKIHLITDKNSVNSFVCHVNDPLIVCQTTVSKQDIKESLNALLSLYPKAKIAAKRCVSTEMRQENLERETNNYDLVVVLGSSTSNNTQRLFTMAKQRFTNATVWRVLSAGELKQKPLDSYHRALVISGASSAASEVIAIKNVLKLYH